MTDTDWTNYETGPFCRVCWYSPEDCKCRCAKCGDDRTGCECAEFVPAPVP